MSACEKCWRDAHYGDVDSVAVRYHELLVERAGHPCSPEEQAGPYAKPCADCNGRLVLHQHTGECMHTNHARPKV